MRHRRLSKWPALWMGFPAVALYVVFVIVPAFGSAFISLFDWSGLGPISHFVGLGNYFSLLKYPLDQQFQNAVIHNLFVLTFGTIMVQVPALTLALLVWRQRRFATVLKTIYVLPFAISPVVVAVLWKLMLNPQSGAVPAAMSAIGLGGFVSPWIGDPSTSLTATILIGNWGLIGFNVLIWMAGLAAISSEVLDAARIEAGWARIIWHVVLPLLRSTFILELILSMVGSFAYFEMVYLVEGALGGPTYSTDVLMTLSYRLTFGGPIGASATSFGQGSAIGTLMVLFVVPISLALVALRRRYDYSY